MTQGLSHLLQSSSKHVVLHALLRNMFAAIALRTPVTGISISPGIVGTETGFAASTFCATGAAFGASGRASTTAATASSSSLHLLAEYFQIPLALKYLYE